MQQGERDALRVIRDHAMQSRFPYSPVGSTLKHWNALDRLVAKGRIKHVRASRKTGWFGGYVEVQSYVRNAKPVKGYTRKGRR